VFRKPRAAAPRGNWKTLVLSTHSEQDYRCPVSEGLMLFEALQYRVVDSELLVFPDETHWMRSRRTSWLGTRTCCGSPART
jgi:dipeptidyl aminopeptidase/acylaminoacyl peptidase